MVFVCYRFQRVCVSILFVNFTISFVKIIGWMVKTVIQKVRLETELPSFVGEFQILISKLAHSHLFETL